MKPRWSYWRDDGETRLTLALAAFVVLGFWLLPDSWKLSTLIAWVAFTIALIAALFIGCYWRPFKR